MATLPTDNAVRCLTLPPEQPELPIRKDHIDWSPDAPDEGSVFAFQAPVDEIHPLDPTETEGLAGSDLVPFRIACDGSVDFQGSNPAAPLTLTIPFSTPGPRWTSPQPTASCCPRRPFSALSMYRSTNTGTQKVRDSPLPFSTPGPFIPARSTGSNGHVLDCGLATQLGVAYNKVLPVAERTGVTSLLGSYSSTINSLDAPLSPVHCDDGEQFLGSFSLSPKLAFGDVAGPLPYSATVPSAVYFDPLTESPLFSPMPENAPAVPADQLVVANSSGDLSRGSPAAVMQGANATDSTARGKHAVFLSDFQLDQRFIYGVLPLTLSPIASLLDGDTESFLNLERPPANSDSIVQRQFSVTPSPLLPSRCLPAGFGWVSSNIHTPDGFESIESIDGPGSPSARWVPRHVRHPSARVMPANGGRKTWMASR